MTNEELNTALYKKVFAEQEKYREWQAASASCTAISARMTRCWAQRRSIAGWSKSCKAKYIAKHGMPKMRFHDLRHPYVKHTTKNKSLQKCGGIRVAYQLPLNFISYCLPFLAYQCISYWKFSVFEMPPSFTHSDGSPSYIFARRSASRSTTPFAPAIWRISDMLTP